MRSAITVCLVPEAKAGPFVFHGDLEQSCSHAAELGFDAIELFPPDAESIDARSLRSLLANHGLRLAAMGTGAGWVRHKLSLTHPDPAIRQRAQQFIGAIVDLAGGLGAPAILGSMQGKAEGDVTHDQAIAWLGQALEQLGPRAAQFEVPFLVEPLNRYETNLLNTVEQTLGLFGGLRTRNLRILADLFHMNIEEVDVPAALIQAGSSLGHVHFADSNRRAVGFGHAAIRPAIQALALMNYGGYLSAEILPLPDAEAAARQTMASFKSFSGR